MQGRRGPNAAELGVQTVPVTREEELWPHVLARLACTSYTT